jgi:hypothetical protein
MGCALPVSESSTETTWRDRGITAIESTPDANTCIHGTEMGARMCPLPPPTEGDREGPARPRRTHRAFGAVEKIGSRRPADRYVDTGAVPGGGGCLQPTDRDAAADKGAEPGGSWRKCNGGGRRPRSITGSEERSSLLLRRTGRWDFRAMDYRPEALIGQLFPCRCHRDRDGPNRSFPAPETYVDVRIEAGGRSWKRCDIGVMESQWERKSPSNLSHKLLGL